MLTVQLIEDVDNGRFIIDIEEFKDIFGEGNTIDEAFDNVSKKLLNFISDNPLIFSNKNFPTNSHDMKNYIMTCYEEHGTYFPLL